MFKRIRKFGKRNYLYLEKSYRVGNKVKKISLHPTKQKLSKFPESYGKELKPLEELEIEHITKHLSPSRFLKSEMIKNIEKSRIQFKLLWDLLDKNSQEEILNEFFTRFLVNNMIMEGSTITYNSAERINKILTSKRKIPIIKIPKVSDEDIRLYIQLKKAYNHLTKHLIRTPKNIANLHKIIYNNIYSFAGTFRKKDITFGNPAIELAITSRWSTIRKDFSKAIKKYSSSKGKKYAFERIINFHIDYQQTHGFEDGNSRLGRLIMIRQLIQYHYPPLIIRHSQTRTYRTSLVKAINHNYPQNFIKLIYKNYKRTYEKFWLPRLRKKVSKKIAKKYS